MLKVRTMAKGMTEEQWSAAIRQTPKTLLSSNTKLAKANIFQWSIPAAASMIVQNDKLVELKTCPGAGQCLNFCYASVGSFAFKGSMIAHGRNLQYVIDKPFDFAEQMISEIKRKRKCNAVRIHDAGDFFNRAYFMVWKTIMESLPDIRFYAYTKMVPMFKKMEAEGVLPTNFTVIYSMGGRFDSWIDMNKDRHSRVFMSMRDCLAAGYVCNNYNDIYAVNPKNRKIGLVVHNTVAYRKRSRKAVGKMVA